jgi:phage terminase large subunit
VGGSFVTQRKPVIPSEGGEFELKYIPRAQQYQLHQSMKRFNVVLCHRRFGKSVMAINLLIDQAIKSERPLPRFAYIAPNYAQAKRIAWEYFKEFTKNIPGVQFNESELRIDFVHNAARIMILSAENPMALKGIYLDFVVLDEYGDMNPVIWREVIRPTLGDRKGRALFIGTVKGRNHFWELYEYAMGKSEAGLDFEWYGAMFKASETRIIPDLEIESIKKSMTEEEFLQEYECDPLAGNVGAYFAREMGKVEVQGGIKEIPYDPHLFVDTGWDLGINDVTAIWFFQMRRGHYCFIDYYEVAGLSIPEIVHDLKLKNYRYGRTIVPHDSNSRDINTGKTTTQLLYQEGFRQITVIPRVKSKRMSINAAKMILPNCSFDRKKCDKGIKALQQYKRKWDEKTQSFADHPLHDWSSNAADAFQQIALGIRDDTGDSGMTNDRSSAPLMEAVTEYNPYSV